MSSNSLSNKKISFELESSDDFFAEASADTLSGKLTVTASRNEPDTSHDGRRAKCTLTFTIEPPNSEPMEKTSKAEFYSDIQDCLREHVEEIFASESDVTEFSTKLKKSIAAKAQVKNRAPSPKMK